MAAEQSTQTTPETWKPVVGYEGYYEVSDHGNVRSVDRTVQRSDGVVQRFKGHLRKPQVDEFGYLRISLRKDGKSHHFRVHRLVLEAFVGPCPEGTEACHGDGDRSNNRLENLRWDTKSENQYDRVRHGNHCHALKTHCPRGHALEAPNLVPSAAKKGLRGCLACQRTHTYLQKHEELKGDFKKISDSYYRVIMSPDA